MILFTFNSNFAKVVTRAAFFCFFNTVFSFVKFFQTTLVIAYLPTAKQLTLLIVSNTWAMLKIDSTYL